MLKWFRRKNPDMESESAPRSAEPAASRPGETGDEGPLQGIVRAWDSRIAELSGAFTDMLAKARAGSESLAQRGDLTALSQPWGAIEAQLHRHTEAISEAWDEILDQLSEVEGIEGAVVDREGRKRDLSSGELDIAYQRAYRQAMAAGARALYHRALVDDARELSCQNCGARLDRIRGTGQARHLECGYCNAVNTIEPGAQMRVFAATGAMWLAEDQALPSWEEMRRSEGEITSFREPRDVPLPLLERYHRAATDYWTLRFQVEAEYAPDRAAHVPMMIESRLKEARKLLVRHRQWHQAG